LSETKGHPKAAHWYAKGVTFDYLRVGTSVEEVTRSSAAFRDDEVGGIRVILATDSFVRVFILLYRHAFPNSEAQDTIDVVVNLAWRAWR
jgi:hypothetical protein